MTTSRKPALHIVKKKTGKLDMAEDIYRHGRERALDRAHWAKLHIRSDRSPAVQLGQMIKRIVLGHGVRLERGGFRPEKRP